MKNAIKSVVILDFVFIFMLALSGFFNGAVADIVYYSAFILPIAAAVLLNKKFGVAFSPPKLKISRKSLLLTLPTVAPTLALVFLLSWLTSLLLSFVSEGSVTDVSGNIFLVILRHAVLTAILEELLFRYLPIAFLAPHSRLAAAVYSSLFFALAHCNLYQIPYALLAGFIFAVLDMASDSILPSLLIHAVNNLVSIFWIRCGENALFGRIYVAVLVSGAVISMIFICIFRGHYKEKLFGIVNRDQKLEFSYEAVLFALVTLFVAVTGL